MAIKPRHRPETAKPARASSPQNEPEREVIPGPGNLATGEVLSEDKPSSDPDGFLITPPLLLSLQRLAGNRAVSALVRKPARTSGGGHTEGAGELVVQTTRKKYPTTHAPGPTAQGEFETFADQV